MGLHVLVLVGNHGLGLGDEQVELVLTALHQAQTPDALQQGIPSGIYLSLGGAFLVQNDLGVGESLLKGFLGGVGDAVGGQGQSVVIGLLQQGLVCLRGGIMILHPVQLEIVQIDGLVILMLQFIDVCIVPVSGILGHNANGMNASIQIQHQVGASGPVEIHHGEEKGSHIFAVHIDRANGAVIATGGVTSVGIADAEGIGSCLCNLHLHHKIVGGVQVSVADHSTLAGEAFCACVEQIFLIHAILCFHQNGAPFGPDGDGLGQLRFNAIGGNSHQAVHAIAGGVGGIATSADGDVILAVPQFVGIAAVFFPGEYTIFIGHHWHIRASHMVVITEVDGTAYAAVFHHQFQGMLSGQGGGKHVVRAHFHAVQLHGGEGVTGAPEGDVQGGVPVGVVGQVEGTVHPLWHIGTEDDTLFCVLHAEENSIIPRQSSGDGPQLIPGSHALTGGEINDLIVGQGHGAATQAGLPDLFSQLVVALLASADHQGGFPAGPYAAVVVDGTSLTTILLRINGVRSIQHQRVVFHDGLALFLVGDAIHHSVAIGDDVVFISVRCTHVVGVFPGHIQTSLLIPEMFVDALHQVFLPLLPHGYHVISIAQNIRRTGHDFIDLAIDDVDNGGLGFGNVGQAVLGMLAHPVGIGLIPVIQSAGLTLKQSGFRIVGHMEILLDGVFGVGIEFFQKFHVSGGEILFPDG